MAVGRSGVTLKFSKVRSTYVNRSAYIRGRVSTMMLPAGSFGNSSLVKASGFGRTEEAMIATVSVEKKPDLGLSEN